MFCLADVEGAEVDAALGFEDFVLGALVSIWWTLQSPIHEAYGRIVARLFSC